MHTIIILRVFYLQNLMMELKNYDQNEKAGVVAAAAMQDAMQSGSKFSAERPFPVGQEYDQEKMGVIPVCIILFIAMCQYPLKLL